MTDKKKTTCDKCGSEDVQVKAWVNPNNLKEVEIITPQEDNDTWCNACQEHTGVSPEED